MVNRSYRRKGKGKKVEKIDDDLKTIFLVAWKILSLKIIESTGRRISTWTIKCQISLSLFFFFNHRGKIIGRHYSSSKNLDQRYRSTLPIRMYVYISYDLNKL